KPASVTEAESQTHETYAVKTKAVTAVTAVTRKNNYSEQANTATQTENPPLVVTVTPAAVSGGVGSTGRVTLGAAAPVGGAIVTLASNNLNAATVPASVAVAVGATSATFAVTTKTVTAVTAVTLTATYSGVAKTATLTVNP